MKMIKIYLAGKMGGLDFDDMNEWRMRLKSKLRILGEKHGYVVEVINPVDFYNFTSKKHQSEREIKDYDLAHVVTSDLVVVNLDGLDTSDGTKIEIHDAKYHCQIPVIAFGSYRLYENLHPWNQDNITRVEETEDDLLKYIEEFYLIN